MNKKAIVDIKAKKTVGMTCQNKNVTSEDTNKVPFLRNSRYGSVRKKSHM